MNPFYSAPQNPVDFTVARSIQIRQQWAALEAAFDKLAGRTTYVVAGGTANALTVALLSPPDEYEEGMMLFVKITETNTGPATIDVNGLGPVPIVTRVNDPLVAGDLVADSVETLFYVDGHFMIREVAGAQGPVGPQGPADGPVGPQGPAGPQGVAGVDGRAVLHGAGGPDNALGLNGDFYINTTAWQIHGPKAGDVWPAGVNLIGAQGPQGAPGVQGLQGPAGPAGAPGAPGADGAGSTWADLGARPAKLVDLGDLAGAADKLPYLAGADDFALTDLTAFGRSLLAANNLAALAGAAGVVGVSEVSLTNPGYIRLNVGDGLVLSVMWGTAVAAGNGYTTVTYPDGGFSAFSVAVCSAPGKIDNDAQDNGPQVESAATASFRVHSSFDNSRTIQWVAIGK